MRNYSAIISFAIFFGSFLLSPAAHAAAKKANKSATEKTEDRGIAVVEKNHDSFKRVALVIGNSAYTNSPLKNPVNDAKDIAAKLRGLGFDVVERSNLKIKQIGGTLREFRSKLAPGAVALVFYAGHGLQIKGDNYLPAVDADINSEEDVHNQSLALRQIMDVLDESKSRLNLVFLDACRNNPYATSFRSAGRGLARVSAPSGTLVSYATKPGSVAADGTGRNGLYTSKLLAQMDSNQQIELTLKRVVTEVKVASNGKQEPWMEGSIEGDYCFGGCAESGGIQTESPPPATSGKNDAEDALWTEVQKSNSIDDYGVYLTQYPNGTYAALAKIRIKKLQDNEAAAAKANASRERKMRYENELAKYNDALKQFDANKQHLTNALEKASPFYEDCRVKANKYRLFGAEKVVEALTNCMESSTAIQEYTKYFKLSLEPMPVAPVKPE